MNLETVQVSVDATGVQKILCPPLDPTLISTWLSHRQAEALRPMDKSLASTDFRVISTSFGWVSLFISQTTSAQLENVG